MHSAASKRPTSLAAIDDERVARAARVGTAAPSKRGGSIRRSRTGEQEAQRGDRHCLPDDLSNRLRHVGGLCIGPAWASPAGEHLLAGDPARLTPFEREHLPVLHAPEFTINKAKVPLVVEMAHPMTGDHYIETIEVTGASDRVPGKGVFHLAPVSGRVYLAFQARVDPGKSELTVTAICNRHGRWSCRRRIDVDEGGSGCSGTDPSIGRPASGEVHPPAIRIAELVKDGRLRRGQVMHAQVKIRHPNRRGRRIREGKIDLESKPLYLEQMEVEYAGEPICKFALTEASSDDPFLTFALCPKREGTLKVVFSNNRGQKLEAMHQVRFS